MKPTKSEYLFEKFALEQGWNISKIPESGTKTPDYDVRINSKRMIFEIKEIEETKEDKKNKKLLKERGYGDVISRTPGQYVRAKIISAKRQLKKYKDLQLPMLIVLYDNTLEWFTKLESYEILTGMYGLESMVLSLPRDRNISPYAVGMKYGGKSQINRQHNTSISAVAVIVEKYNKLKLDIYHNHFASIKIADDGITGSNICHYRLVCGDGYFDRPTWVRSK